MLVSVQWATSRFLHIWTGLYSCWKAVKMFSFLVNFFFHINIGGFGQILSVKRRKGSEFVCRCVSVFLCVLSLTEVGYPQLRTKQGVCHFDW